MIRRTLRQWMRSPAATVVIVLTLGMTVGGVATVFTTFDALLLRDLPVREPDRLVRMATISPRGETRDQVAWTDFQGLRHVTDRVTVAAFQAGGAVVRDPATGRTEVVGVEWISDGFFEVAGARLLRGAPPRSGERGVVVSERFADATTLVIDDVTYTVTGVTAFRGLNVITPAVIWIPMQPTARVRLIGRLEDGATLAEAERVLTAALPDRLQAAAVRVGPERAMLVAPDAPGMLSLAIGIAATLALGVVLVAAANVIGLLLARMAVRRNELAVRAALGATGARIARQVILETLPLAIPSALVAHLIAILGSRALTVFMPPMLVANVDFRPGVRVALFAIALSAIATLFSGAAAALHARRMNFGNLGARGGATGAPVALRVLVVAQLAFTSVVLIAAGLLVQNARAYRAIEPGFEYARQLTVTFVGAAPRASRVRELADLLRGVNGITHVAIARNTPMSRQTSAVIRVADETRDGHVSQIEGDFFAAAGIPLLHGHSTTRTAAGTAVVNEAAGVGVGGMIFVDNREHLVVGVVRDARMSSLAEPPRPYVWLPWDESSQVRLQLRSARDLGAVTRDVNAVLRGAGVTATVARLEDIVQDDRLFAQAASAMSGALGALTLLLAAVGLFGVVSTIVTSRRRELAVRMALGATPAAVARLVAAGSARLLVFGLVLGAALAVPAALALASLLFGVDAFDATSWALVPLLIATVVACATFVPATRAMRTDPAQLLQEI